MSSVRNSASYLLAFSIFALAIAIAWFAWSMQKVAVSLPASLETTQATIKDVKPVVDELLVQVPDILEEVEAIRAVIPPVLEELAQLRQALPPILSQIDTTVARVPPITQDVQTITESIPPVLDQIDKLSTETVQPLLTEVATLREETLPVIQQDLDSIHDDITAILAEIELLRADVPDYLTRVEVITENIRQAGQQASEGAVTGVLTGIIKSPFTLMSNLTSETRANSRLDVITPADKQALDSIGLQLLNRSEQGYSQEYMNARSGLHGRIVLSEKVSDTEAYLDAELKDDADRVLIHRRYHAIQDSLGEWTMQGFSDL